MTYKRHDLRTAAQLHFPRADIGPDCYVYDLVQGEPIRDDATGNLHSGMVLGWVQIDGGPQITPGSGFDEEYIEE